MRQEGHSRGVARDIVLAESVISSCLSAVAALSSDHDSHVSSSEIGRLAMENGIGRLAALQ
jgi:hypothetical protein